MFCCCLLHESVDLLDGILHILVLNGFYSLNAMEKARRNKFFKREGGEATIGLKN
jgi:hypothetical protein